MKFITTEYIESLNPCQNRLDNWKQHYNDLKIPLDQFLDLDKITHDDKLWVYFKSIDLDLISIVAADFAEQVLHIYESQYPNDDRPRKAIEAARIKNTSNAALNAANTARIAAKAATYAAADAARINANAATYAAANAANAAANAAADAAADAANAAANAAADAANAAAYAARIARIADNAATNAVHIPTKKLEDDQIAIMKRYL